jgi:Hemerythrin HHE cation binding domain
MDITEVILEQHHEQRRMFAVLDEMPRGDTAALGAVWARLEVLLEVHAEAEEKFFYPRLLKLGKGNPDGDVDEEVEDAIKDHNDIREGIRKAAQHDVGSDEWWDAVIECRVSNSDHMAEEERQDLADFRRNSTMQQRHDIAVKFLRYEAMKAATGVAPEDKDPEEYVRRGGE